MLRKIINYQSLENSQENVFDGVSFSKTTRLECTDCNAIDFAIDFFWNMSRELAVLKRIF